MNPELTSNFELTLKPKKQVKKTINSEFSDGCQKTIGPPRTISSQEKTVQNCNHAMSVFFFQEELSLRIYQVTLIS